MASVGIYVTSSAEKDYIPLFGSAMLLYFIFTYINKANMKKEGPAIDYVDPRVQ